MRPALSHLAALLLCAAVPALAMTVNLKRPYDSAPSTPRSAELAFFAPERADYLFTEAVPPRLVVQPFRRALDIAWRLTPNLARETVVRSGVAPVGPDNAFVLTPSMDGLPPGFYDLHVEVKLAPGETLSAFTTFGWRADRMAVHASAPADFDAFWTKALNTLPAPAAEAIEITKTTLLTGAEIGEYNRQHASLPPSYDPAGERHDQVEVYRVRFPSAKGRSVEGWFAKPAGPGPFPALLVLPGAGNNPRPAPVEHARHGYAALDIQVHGNGVDEFVYAAPPDDSRVKTPEEKIHYQIYLNAVQASRTLPLLPGVDAGRMAVLGGSQGGRLSIVVAALNPDIRAAIPAISHYAYIPWLRWALSSDKKETAFDGDPAYATKADPHFGYLDTLNFASRIRCPVLFNAGMIDRVSPVTGIYALYLTVPGEKAIIPLPNLAHDWSPAFDRQAWAWLAEKLR